MEDKRKLLKSAGWVGFLTMISRIFGYARDAVLAMVLGAGLGMDAFAIAFRLASLFRRLLGEGAMTAAFTPILIEYKEQHSREELWKFACNFFYTFSLILIGLMVIQIIFAPEIVKLMSPGFTRVTGKWELAILLNRLMAPYMLFVGLSAVLMVILNSFSNYGIPAANPIAFNIAVIISAFTISNYFSEPAIGIAMGVLLGGFLQMLVQVPSVWEKGMRFIPSFSFNHPANHKIARLMIPGVVGIGAYQINVFVDSIFASLLPQGSVSAIYYSTRITELVQGVFVISFARVILTEMSKNMARNESGMAHETMSFTLRMISFVTVPASVGLIILAQPITHILFERGQFTTLDTERCAFALMFYAVGIHFAASARIMIQAFYAAQDTATPVRCAFASLFINIIGNIIFMRPLQQGGIALATSLAAVVNFLLLLWIYERRFGKLDWRAIRESWIKIGWQTVAMALTCYSCIHIFHYSKESSSIENLIPVFLSIGLGLGAYILTGFLVKSAELHLLLLSHTGKPHSIIPKSNE